MDYTNNDVSGDGAKLDYPAVLQTAKIAYSRSLEEIYKNYTELRGMNVSEPDVRMYLRAGYLRREAQALTTAAETLYTLLCAYSRDIQIIHAPDIAE